MRGHLEGAFVAGAPFFFHFDDSGNDLAGLLDEDGVADADVLALDFLLVVERGAGNGAARDGDGSEFGDGGEGACAADLDGDVEEAGLGALGFVFVGDCPARGLGGRAEFAAEGEAVEFNDGAIRLVDKIVTDAAEHVDGSDDAICIVRFKNFFGDG